MKKKHSLYVHQRKHVTNTKIKPHTLISITESWYFIPIEISCFYRFFPEYWLSEDCNDVLFINRYDIENLSDGLTGITNLVEHPIQMKPPGKFIMLIVIGYLIVTWLEKKSETETRIPNQWTKAKNPTARPKPSKHEEQRQTTCKTQ